jgi:hypothetical protein
MPQNNGPDILTNKKRGGISLDILWVLVILFGFLFFTSLIPLPPNDFWWHLKIGEYIYNNHSIPTTNMFAWTLPSNQPFFYGAWLAELFFYILYRLGDLSLIIFMRTVLIGITVWFVATEAHRRSNSWRITALVVALLSLMITNNLPVRTQMWAWLPFISTYIVLKRYSELALNWHWLLLCPLSMILWVNVHGSFILGLIIPGAFFAGEALRRLLKNADALNWLQIGRIGATGILSGLAIFVNPRFGGIVSYTINLLTNPPSQQLIEEWQSPTPQGIANITFYISILVFIIILAYSKYRLSSTEIILIVGFLWLAWSGQRYVIWYGFITLPILARLIKDLPIKMPVLISQKNWLNLVLILLLFTPLIAVQPWFVEHLPLPGTYWQQVLRGSPAGQLLSVHTPVSAAEYIKTHPGGHLFNEMGYGSYLIWAIPEQGVFVDTRVELFPYDQWLDYIHVNNGTNYNEILARYGADRILLDKELQPELAASLIKDSSWKLEFNDEHAQIWTKASNP